MKNYVKPVVLTNEELAEGVYAASGGEDWALGCYKTGAYITQKPETGRGNFIIQFNADHNADHDSTGQILVISFNQPVKWVWSEGPCINGDGTSTLEIEYHYHSNTLEEGIGLGNLTVESDSGLEIVSTALKCNHRCDQHDGLGHY